MNEIMSAILKFKQERGWGAYHTPENSTLSQQLKHEWGELDLACKAIFIIGTLLVIQLFYSIFCPLAFISSSVDSIFRTSLSSIFVYILGITSYYQHKHATNTY